MTSADSTSDTAVDTLGGKPDGVADETCPNRMHLPASAVHAILTGWQLFACLVFLIMVGRLIVESPRRVNRDPNPTQDGLFFTVDINAASIPELQALPEIGPSLARRIVDFREQVGRYEKLDDLLRVHGFGPKTLDKLRPMLIVSEDSELEAIATR